jgi:release factor glutamine methyltransferase
VSLSTTAGRRPDGLVREVAATLAAAGVPCPAVDARRLVEAALASDDPGPELDRLVSARASRVPLQVVLGHTWFRHLRLRCRSGVFVPRPETEVVAGVAIEAARGAGPRPTVVEPCTGTGAIALAVATEVAGAHVTASDVSPAAVALARENLDAVRTGAAEVDGLAPGATCAVHEGDLLAGLDDLRGRIDVLVSNPPYLPTADRGSWEPEVARHDPDVALVGGPDGHEVVDRLLLDAATWLAPGGVVVLEIDERRGADAARAAEAAGLVDVVVLPDLTGADRMVRARRPGDAA